MQHVAKNGSLTIIVVKLSHWKFEGVLGYSGLTKIQSVTQLFSSVFSL